jgi:hypothetical protein
MTCTPIHVAVGSLHLYQTCDGAASIGIMMMPVDTKPASQMMVVPVCAQIGIFAMTVQ